MPTQEEIIQNATKLVGRGEAGGGIVKVIIDYYYRLIDIRIDIKACGENNVLLEELILSANQRACANLIQEEQNYVKKYSSELIGSVSQTSQLLTENFTDLDVPQLPIPFNKKAN